MLNKYTIIGLVAGCIISGIGVISFADSVSTPIEKMEFSDVFQPGEKTTFPFSAPKDSKHYLTVEGDSFIVKIKSPDSDEKINQNFKNFGQNLNSLDMDVFNRFNLHYILPRNVNFDIF